MREIRLGEGVYVIERIFSREHSVSDLIAERLLQERKEETAFDECGNDAV